MLLSAGGPVFAFNLTLAEVQKMKHCRLSDYRSCPIRLEMFSVIEDYQYPTFGCEKLSITGQRNHIF
jgi:hypothetical protein